jgi:hypothetical protein
MSVHITLAVPPQPLTMPRSCVATWRSPAHDLTGGLDGMSEPASPAHRLAR